MMVFRKHIRLFVLMLSVVAGSAMSANAPPAILGPSNVTVQQNSPASAVAGLSVTDPDAGANFLSLTLFCNNGALTLTLPFGGGVVTSNGNITFMADQVSATASLMTLQYAPNAGFFGNDTITIVANDQGDGGVNPPVQTTKTITVLVDRVPTITTPPDALTTPNTATLPLPFTVNDLDTGAASVTVIGISSDQTVVPNGNIIFGGSGSNRTVTVIPTSLTGSVVITLIASDPSAFTSSTTFMVDVVPNTAPTITGLTDQIIFEDTQATQTFMIGDGETPPANLTLKATSTDQTIVPNANIVFTPNGAAPSVKITPAPFHPGMVSIQVTVTDPGGLSSNSNFTLTILHVNHAPILNPGSPILSSIPANSGMGTFNPGTLLSAFADPFITEKDAMDPKGIAIIGINSTNGTWYYTIDGGVTWTPIDPAAANNSATLLKSDALTEVRFVPNPNFAGTSTLSFRAWDGTDGHPSGTAGIDVSANGGNTAYSSTSLVATITVNPINTPPSFICGPNQTINEDSGTSLIPGFVTNISPGIFPSESGQTLAFTVTNSNPALFAAAPAITPAGDLSFTTAPNANGMATVSVVLSDNGGTAFGGNDTSAAQTFTITINAVNDAPSFTLPNLSVTVIENSGPTTIPGFATQVSAGPPDESGQLLTFITNSTNLGLFAVPPSLTSNGNLSFTLTANTVGTAIVSVQLKDNGGTALGGADTSPVQTFTITAVPPNTAPSFTLLVTSVVVNENSGPFVGPGFATNISPGIFPSESTQTVNFIVTGNTAPSLFSIAPSISPTGTLSFSPALNANGAATISVVLMDNGGTANGGVDTSAVQTFTITVSPVNNAPSFTLPNTAIGVGNSGATTIANFAINISPGPPNESNQSVSFNILSVSNPALFSIQPNIVVSSLTSNGNLSFTPAPNVFGTAIVAINAHDNGGTANGGIDTSPPQVFTIIIVGSPVAKNSQLTLTEDVVTTGGLLATDPQSLPLTYSIVSNGKLGTAVIGDPTVGVFTYTPNLHVAGTDTITFKVNNGFLDSNLATVTIFIIPRNYPPTITSMNATPNPAGISQTVTFFTAATDIEDGTNLSYAWAFGDGASASGSSVSHAYAAAGTYSATVTITDSGGATVTETVKVVVSVTAYGTGPNSSGNGVSDALTQAILALDPNANPVPTSSFSLHVDSLVIKLNFAKQSSDSIVFSGVLQFPPNPPLKGQILAMDIGGVVLAFKLDDKMRAKTANGTLALTGSKRFNGFQYRIKLKGNFAAPLAVYGLTNATASKAAVSVPLTILFGNSGYVDKPALIYTARVGKSGMARD